MKLEPDYTAISIDLLDDENIFNKHPMQKVMFVVLAANTNNDMVYEQDIQSIASWMHRDILEIKSWLRDLKSKGVIDMITARNYCKITIKPGLAYHGFREE